MTIIPHPRRRSHRLTAFHPDRPMAPVTIRSRQPLDRELADFRAQGFVIARYRSPGLTITNERPAGNPVEPESEAAIPDVPGEDPTALTEPVAPEVEPVSEPRGPVGSKRVQLAALVAELPASDPRSDAALARDLASLIPLHEATARRYLRDIRRTAQDGSAGGTQAAQGVAA